MICTAPLLHALGACACAAAPVAYPGETHAFTTRRHTYEELRRTDPSAAKLYVEAMAQQPIVAMQDAGLIVVNGDSAVFGRQLAPNTIDAIVTDPPAGIGFMGRSWDDDKGGDDHWIAWLADLMRPWFDALKPGGHALVWAIPRTSDWTTRALRLAGFEIRDVLHDMLAGDTLLLNFLASLDDEQRQALLRLLESQTSPVLYQLFGQGMPKSLNIANEIDMHLCTLPGQHSKNPDEKARERMGAHLCPEHPLRVEGRTAFKPAVEHWIVCRKPLEGTVAHNVITYSTGGLNVDACRIGTSKDVPASAAAVETNGYEGGWGGGKGREQGTGFDPNVGRWPAHVVFEHAQGCTLEGVVPEQRDIIEMDRRGGTSPTYVGNETGAFHGSRRAGTFIGEREVWRCVEGCPVRALDEQSGERKSGAKTVSIGPNLRNTVYGRGMGGMAGSVASKGGASRFFATFGADRFLYCPKSPRKEKERGLEHLPARTGGEATDREDGSAGVNNPRAGAGRTGGARNFHPTSKSIALMRWLVRFVTPPGGIVADPFGGSGSTAVGAIEEGMRCLIVEREIEYVPLIVGRGVDALKRSAG